MIFFSWLFFSGGLRLGSDFDTDSEIEPGIFGSSKKPAEEDKDDFDFYDWHVDSICVLLLVLCHEGPTSTFSHWTSGTIVVN